MKKIIQIGLFVVLVAAFQACKSSAGAALPPTTADITTTKETNTTIHKGELEVPADSTYKKLYLECVNGKVVVKKPVKDSTATAKGVPTTPKKTKGSLQEPKAKITDNVLEIDCYQDAQKLFYDWKEVYVKEHQATVQRVPYPVVQPLSWWQKTFIVCGKLFLLCVALTCIGIGLKLSKII